ncbi:hypothetical protein MBLNU457_6015t1 [Dothideomycetes sp. NU457]
MATVFTAAGTGQPFLDLMPINTSFAEFQSHTAVRSAPISPPVSPNSLARPPTPGRGPLSSHPATPLSGGSYFPSSHSYKSSGSSKASSETTSTRSVQSRRDSFLWSSPSPTSQKCTTPQSQHRRRDSASVKRLLSFATLRKSFMGLGGTDNTDTTTSLPLPRAPFTGHEELYTADPFSSPSHRPSTPSLTSSTTTSSLNEPMVIHTYIPAPQPRTELESNKRKSGSWFRRKSGLFMMDSDFTQLRDVTETTPSRPMSVMGFERIMSPAPVLPDIGSLRGGRLTDGAFAGEDIFGVGR